MKCKILAFILFFTAITSGNLQANNTEISVSTPEWPPIIYKDQHGKSKGFYMDMFTEIFTNRLDLQINRRTVPWKRAQFEMQQGETDFIIALPTPERLEYSVASKEPFFQLYMNVYTWNGHPQLEEIQQITTPADIKELGLTVVTNAGNGWHDKHIEPLQIPTITIPADESTIQFLAKKRADILINASIPTNHTIKQYNLQNQLVMTKAHFAPTSLHLLLSKKSSFLPMMHQIDNAFQEAKNSGAIDRILEKYSKLK